MLQIITGKFFRDVELYTTRQRGVLYTNYRMPLAPIQTVCGVLQPAETWRDIATIVYEVDQRLEAIAPDGMREFLLAVPAESLVQDFAAVASFVLRITCTPDLELTHRLTQSRHASVGIPEIPARYVSRVFDEKVDFAEGDAERLSGFVQQLVGLGRSEYEAAIRAIRRYVVGLHRVADDLDFAYTMLVASVESLVQRFDSFNASWGDLPAERRGPIDEALSSTTAEIADSVRDAIVRGEHPALARRFREFVIDHVAPSYFRQDASLELAPLRRSDLRDVLNEAYRFRSKAVHTLGELPREITMLPSLRDTHIVKDRVVLSLHGMARLAHHVICQFVARRPQVAKEEYDYRRSLPNTVPARLAERYWIWRREGYNAKSARSYLSGFLSELTGVLSGRSDAGLTDITPIMDEIEDRVGGLSQTGQRLPMLALYVLFNIFGLRDARRPRFDEIFQRHYQDFAINSPEGLLVHTLTIGDGYEWTAADIAEAWGAYMDQRGRRGSLNFGAFLEAAILITWAEALRAGGDLSGARGRIAQAVEELPGSQALISLETTASASVGYEFAPIHWRVVLLPPRSNETPVVDNEPREQVDNTRAESAPDQPGTGGNAADSTAMEDPRA